MASPHVAGVAALMLSETPGATPAQVASGMLGGATAGKVTSAGTGSPNLLLYSLVSAGGGGNNPPTASFTETCTNLSCNFNGGGSSDDGTITNYSWTFGDGSTGTGATPNKTYATAGTYSVTLTVTDNGGATNATSHSVTVSDPPSGGFSLNASGFKVKGVQNVQLTWTGASGIVDIYRNGVIIGTDNASPYTYSLGVKGPGSYVYKVCNTGTAVCSNEASVIF